MKLKIIIAIIFLFVLPAALAQDVNDFGDYSNLTIQINIDGEFELAGEITDAQAILTFIPQEDDIQTIISKDITANNNADITQSSTEIEYSWETISDTKLEFGWESTFVVNNALALIEEKVEFPLEERFSFYTQPTEFIDITPEIKERAQALAAGEDDLYIVAFKVGSWVQQNIQYNLTTLTAQAVQKSSWVLENREGVCDELTNLFISMMRSLGVPARFVSGMAYTNLGYKWEPHGWAEVYFPDKGWVPFDVTFGQFGWIDPGHVKLKVSEDSGDASVRYQWRGSNSNIANKKIDIIASLVEEGKKISSPLQIEVRTLENNVGPGSYVPIEVEVTNNNNFYLPVNLVITKATGLIDSNLKNEVLKPGETKKIFWISQLPQDTEEGYIYTSIVEVQDQFHKIANTKITYAKDLEITSLEEAQRLISRIKQAATGLASKKLDLQCLGPRYSFSYEDILIVCNLKNTAFEYLEDISVCYNTNCQTSDLGIDEEKSFTFNLNLGAGLQDIEIVARQDSNTASDITSINVLEGPDLEITSINYPKNASYKDNFNISLILVVKAPVKDVKIKINDYNVLEIPELETTKSAIIQTSGRDLFDKENLTISIDFKDLNNREYNVDSSYPIEIANVPWYIKLLNWLRFI